MGAGAGHLTFRTTDSPPTPVDSERLTPERPWLGAPGEPFKPCSDDRGKGSCGRFGALRCAAFFPRGTKLAELAWTRAVTAAATHAR